MTDPKACQVAKVTPGSQACPQPGPGTDCRSRGRSLGLEGRMVKGGGLKAGGDGLGVPMTPPAGPHSGVPVLWVSESVGQRGLVSRHTFRSAAPRLGGRGHVVLPGNKPPP